MKWEAAQIKHGQLQHLRLQPNLRYQLNSLQAHQSVPFLFEAKRRAGPISSELSKKLTRVETSFVGWQRPPLTRKKIRGIDQGRGVFVISVHHSICPILIVEIIKPIQIEYETAQTAFCNDSLPGVNQSQPRPFSPCPYFSDSDTGSVYGGSNEGEMEILGCHEDSLSESSLCEDETGFPKFEIVVGGTERGHDLLLDGMPFRKK